MRKKLFELLFCILIFCFTGCSSILNRSIGREYLTENMEKKYFYSFNSEETSNYKIREIGIDLEKKTWRWTTSIELKKEKKIEYVKVEIVAPQYSKLIIFDDGSGIPLDLGWSENQKTKSLIKNYNSNWYGRSAKQESSQDFEDTFMKGIQFLYLVKITIKSKEIEEEVIYQPIRLPVYVEGAQKVR